MIKKLVALFLISFLLASACSDDLGPGEERHRLLTHCGLSFPMRYDGQNWLPVDPEVRSSFNPPGGFSRDDYYDEGVVRRVDTRTRSSTDRLAASRSSTNRLLEDAAAAIEAAPVTDEPAPICPGWHYVWMRRALGLLAMTGIFLSFTGASVQADTKRAHDSNDARGPLDIAWIQHHHRTTEAGKDRLVHTIRLYERWPVDRLRDRGFIHLFFDLRGDPNWREERAVYITYQDGRLDAELVDFAADPPTFLRNLRLRRPDARTLKITLRRSDLRRRTFGHYDWAALSFIQERHRLCGRSGGCYDWSSRLRHDL